MFISERYVLNIELLMDFTWFGPSKFKEIVKLSTNSLKELSKLSRVNKKTLFVE